jgi:hypothetical protein
VPTLFLSPDAVKEHAGRLTRYGAFRSNGVMSVKMILRIPVDPASMERAANENRDMFLGISDHAKNNGGIHHEFWAGDGEVLAIDEWESPEAFQAFWDAQGPNIGQLMASAGAGEPDAPRFYRLLDLGDTY